MRLLAQLSFLATRDADQRQKLLEQLLTIDDTDETTAKTYQASDLTLLASASDQAVAFGGVTNAAAVLIVAFQEISVKLNAGGAPGGQQSFRITPVPAVASGSIVSQFQEEDQPGVLFVRGKVTSIHLGNPSSTATAEALIVLIGEAL